MFRQNIELVSRIGRVSPASIRSSAFFVMVSDFLTTRTLWAGVAQSAKLSLAARVYSPLQMPTSIVTVILPARNMTLLCAPMVPAIEGGCKKILCLRCAGH